MPVLATNMSRPKPRTQEKVNGSYSDGSVCDVAPFTKAMINRYQQVNHREDHVMPTVKANGVQARKRFMSTGDKDQTASSGYETGSKKSKRDSTVSPVIKAYNPVMENMVSSTNNDVVYKFSGPTPAEDFQVTYTIEERIKAAAFAIVFNNCKISTDKFEALYDKPAPDFKTIFGWRQRLLTTGCLVDSHVEPKKDTATNPPCNEKPIKNLPSASDAKTKTVCRLPNPDEIIIPSESDEELDNGGQKSIARSVSVETLLIPADKDIQAPGSAASTLEDRGSQLETHSQSTHRRTHSSSRDSQDSNYPDTDSERMATKLVRSRGGSCSKSVNQSARQSIRGSDSDSVSYNSEEDNFLSRVFPTREGRRRRKVKRRSAPAPIVKPNNYIPIPNEIQKFEGYSTVKPTTEQSPLVTGNIYTTNLRNMNVRTRENIPADIDNCSSEYVPTRLGSTAKQNYQEFKDNVRKKGYWAKGNNGGTIVKHRRSISMDIVNTPKPAPIKLPEESVVTNYCTKSHTYEVSQPKLDKNQTDDYTKDDIENFVSTEQYIPFDPNPMKSAQMKPTPTQPQLQTAQFKPVQMQQVHIKTSQVQSFQTKQVQIKPVQTRSFQTKPVQRLQNVIKSPENSDRIFALVQSSSATKNRSIMDIFDNNGQVQKSPDRDKELERYDSVRRRYETEWDEDDDALYKKTDSDDALPSPRRTPSPRVGSGRAQSPMSMTLYTTDHDAQLPATPSKSTVDLIKDKQDMLLDLLKDFQNKEIDEVLSPLKHVTPQKQVTPVRPPPPDESNKKKHKIQNKAMTNLYSRPEPIPTELSDEVLRLSGDHASPEEQKNKKNISPSKKVHVLESVTIPPPSTYNYQVLSQEPAHQYEGPNASGNESVQIVSPVRNVGINKEASEKVVATEQASPQASSQLDLSNLLSGINTNTLLLALQNLQQLTQNTASDSNNKQDNSEHENSNENLKTVETINLTNDEDWEKESNRDGSIERQLQRLDGNTGDTPFLGDIFDPGPIAVPPNVARKLNLDVNCPEDQSKSQSNLNENAPVIGNFKSFALPKPILLNRLKVTVKAPDKSSKKSAEGKRVKRKKKVCIHIVREIN